MKNFKNNANASYYVFDVGALLARVEYLKNSLPENVSLCYAVKANTFIIGELLGHVARFEVCSPGEAEICSALEVPDSQTVISGVYKTPAAIETMVREHSERIFTVESRLQFDLLKELSEKYSAKLKLLLRLTNDSQFGLDAACVEQIVAERDNYELLSIEGIQYFSGTQKTSLKKLKREVERLDAFITDLYDKFGFVCRELEYGPGFPVAYFEGEEFDEPSLLEGFSNLVFNMKNKLPISLELGRSIAASCGCYCAKIVDLKQNRGQNYALIDGGMHHLVYFGQHMAMKRPFFCVLGKENEPPEKEWNICGSLCSMNDIVVKQAMLPKVRVGDTLCFKNTGAYCMTEGISLFLSRELPAVYLLKNDELLLVRRSFETSVLNKPEY